MYAWDSNSWPGNEYWDGQIKASDDPAAACCSLIAEMQNPFINKHMLQTCNVWPSTQTAPNAYMTPKPHSISDTAPNAYFQLPDAAVDWTHSRPAA